MTSMIAIEREAVRITAIESHNPMQRILLVVPNEIEIRPKLAGPSPGAKAEFLRRQLNLLSVGSVHPAIVPDPFLTERPD